MSKHHGIGPYALTTIKRFEKAVEANSWAGSQPPEERPAIEQALVDARAKLESYIASLQERVRS